jgi:hypothetical protein
MNNPLKMNEADKIGEVNPIQEREVGEEVQALKTLDPSLSKYDFGDLKHAVEFAKLMCQAGEMLPKHAQRNPSICLALTMRATQWGFDPYGLALESYQAQQGGPIAFQAKVFSAVARKAKIILQYRYEGDLTITDKPALSAKGNTVAKRSAVGNIRCICFATDGGHVLEYETPELDQITIKNSALWHNDPKQQLAYYAARGWMRRYRSDLMLGAFSDEEVQQINMRDVTPKPEGGGFSKMITDARKAAASEASAQETTDDGKPDGADDTSDDEDPEIDPEHPALKLGFDAAAADLGAGECPFREDPDSARHWLAGWESHPVPDEEEEGDKS